MKLSNSKMVEECMARIELLQTMIKQVEEAGRYLYQRHNDHIKIEGNLRALLVEEELGEWRNLCMWGLTVSPAEQDRIKAAVHQRFLREDMCVSHWLNDGISPGRWLVADEEEFRSMAAKAFAPSADKKPSTRSGKG